MRQLLITRADGGLSVMHLRDDADGATELALWEASADPAWLPVVSTRLDADVPLPERTLRDGWKDSGTGVVVDTPLYQSVADVKSAKLKSVSKDVFNDKAVPSQIDRSIILTAVDEINILRQRLRDQDAVIASATSLADLKAKWAQLATTSPLPDRTNAQARGAIYNKIDSGDAD